MRRVGEKGGARVPEERPEPDWTSVEFELEAEGVSGDGGRVNAEGRGLGRRETHALLLSGMNCGSICGH